MPYARLNLLASPGGRRALFTSLYFMEGAPIGFVWWALPTIAAESGADAAELGAFGATLVLPWALKFLWAPLVDVLRGPQWSFRAWIVACQLAMAATIAPLALLDLGELSPLLRALLLAHAFAAATQDVSIDGLAVRVVPAEERGAINGWMNAGMMSARAIFGASTLFLVDELGGRAVVLFLVALLSGGTLLALLYEAPAEREAVTPGGARAERVRAFLRTGREALARRATWLGLAFALVAGAGFEAAAYFAGPFLLDLGLEKQTVGKFLGTAGVGGLVAGGLAGGRLADRIGRRAASGLSIVLVAALVAGLALLGSSEGAVGSPLPVLVLLGALYLGIGLLTASSYALFMDLTEPRLGATQFSAYMGATNACEQWSVVAAGRIAGARGYPVAFAVLAAASLLALPVLALLRVRAPRR